MANQCRSTRASARAAMRLRISRVQVLAPARAPSRCGPRTCRAARCTRRRCSAAPRRSAARARPRRARSPRSRPRRPRRAPDGGGGHSLVVALADLVVHLLDLGEERIEAVGERVQRAPEREVAAGAQQPVRLRVAQRSGRSSATPSRRRRGRSSGVAVPRLERRDVDRRPAGRRGSGARARRVARRARRRRREAALEQRPRRLAGRAADLEQPRARLEPGERDQVVEELRADTRAAPRRTDRRRTRTSATLASSRPDTRSVESEARRAGLAQLLRGRATALAAGGLLLGGRAALPRVALTSRAELLPPRLDAPGEFAIFAARSFDMPLSFRPRTASRS